jgi:hypothetical protein
VVEDLVAAARQIKALVDGKEGSFLESEDRKFLTNEFSRIFRTYVMVFGLESINL